MKPEWQRGITPYLYVAPTVVSTLVFVIYPFLANIAYSLTDWDGFGVKNFVGLRNFIDLARDERFRSALSVNLLYIVFVVIVPILLGLMIASVIGRSKVRGLRAYQTIYFIPQVVAAIAIGVIFRWVYAPLFGVLNHLLQLAGLRHLARPWLGGPETASVAIGLIGTWAWFGFCVILFVAGIQKIDEHLYEAAKLDGAGPARQFLHVTLPDLRFEIVVALIMATIQALGGYIFSVVRVSTNGAYGTRPIGLYAYQLAFVEGRVGYASAVILVLTMIILAVASLGMLFGERGSRAT